MLNVTALGATLADAQARVYEAVRAIRFTGGWYRRDIADRAICAAVGDRSAAESRVPGARRAQPGGVPLREGDRCPRRPWPTRSGITGCDLVACMDCGKLTAWGAVGLLDDVGEGSAWALPRRR